MKIHIIILIIPLFFCSFCTKNSQNKHAEVSELDTKTKSDSILYLVNTVSQAEIWCTFFGRYYDESFVVYLSNSELVIKDYFNRSNIDSINSIDIKNNLTEYINTLFIEKTENIVYSENKEPIPVADYPSIKVVFQNSKGKVETVNVTLYHNIVFNPIFMEFYKLLESLSTKTELK